MKHAPSLTDLLLDEIHALYKDIAHHEGYLKHRPNGLFRGYHQFMVNLDKDDIERLECEIRAIKGGFEQ